MTWAFRLERLRWWRARRVLRYAGHLLARSHPDTLWAQTSRTSFVVRDGHINLDLPDGRSLELSRQDAHGLLLQLAAANVDVELYHRRAGVP